MLRGSSTKCMHVLTKPCKELKRPDCSCTARCRSMECLLICYLDAMAAGAYMGRPTARRYFMLMAFLPEALCTPQHADLVLLSCQGVARGSPPAVNKPLLALLVDLFNFNWDRAPSEKHRVSLHRRLACMANWIAQWLAQGGLGSCMCPTTD